MDCGLADDCPTDMRSRAELAEWEGAAPYSDQFTQRQRVTYTS